MKCQLSIQEKLKDLRVEKGFNLEELAAETGLSKSALGSYETTDHKDISHTAIIALAKYYGVSADYLLGFSENRNELPSDISALKLDDDAIGILKSDTINNRLLCEIIKHPDFWKFMNDTEIYVDSLAEMQIQNLNSFITLIRSKIQMRNQIPDSEHYLRTLKACEIDEDDYFSRRIFEDISAIAKDIKQSHRRDTETGDENSPLTDVIDVVKEFAMATDPMKATLSTLSKQLGMNFNKMDPAEVEYFSQHLSKNIQPHIEACCQRRAVAKNSDFQSRSSSAPTDVQGAWGYPQQARQAFVWTQTLLAALRSDIARHCLRYCI